MHLEVLDNLYRERDVLRARLAQAVRLLQAVGAGRRNGDGRIEVSAELERGVVAFTLQGASVAHYANQKSTEAQGMGRSGTDG